LYPIASRCGVFAKTDIQPLLNEGAKREDVAASILQAVVNQTIGGLAQGRKIEGNVAFLGGPLFFSSELRRLFISTLQLEAEQAVIPPDSHFFVAQGAAVAASGVDSFPSERMYKLVPLLHTTTLTENTRLPPLFVNEEEYNQFEERHSQAKAHRNNLSDYFGDAFLGIDAGSTTTKVVLIDSEGAILWEHYGYNKGNPLQSVIEAIRVLNALIEEKGKTDEIDIKFSACTGYGEHLIKAAIGVDIGEIETVAHYRGAAFFQPLADLVIDIGGQDMK
ncbi:hypothetical protein KIPB_009280, partial [Kipferlia bialata]